MVGPEKGWSLERFGKGSVDDARESEGVYGLPNPDRETASLAVMSRPTTDTTCCRGRARPESASRLERTKVAFDEFRFCEMFRSMGDLDASDARPRSRGD